MKTKEEIFSKLKINGILMIILNTLFLFAICGIFVWALNAEMSNGLRITILVVDVILFCLNCLFWGGFMMIEPNEARVMIFFGKYVGTLST